MGVAALIMAGGYGERFWPVSRADLPKQFVGLLPNGRSLFQETYQRISSILGEANVFVVTNLTHATTALAQISSLDPGRIVLEPTGRDTAPCLALGTAKILGELRGNPRIVALPSDHYVSDFPHFKETVERMIEVASYTGLIVTAGIRPTRPERAYGYLRTGRPLTCSEGLPAFEVAEFVEKPQLEKALLMFSEGNWYWNSGLFCYRAAEFMEAYSTCLPSDCGSLHDLVNVFSRNGRPTVDAYEMAFSRLTKISVDFGIMEKWKQVATVPGEFGWDDVGSWPALERMYGQDDLGNTAIGETVLIDTEDCTFVSEESLGNKARSGPRKALVAFGLRDMLVADTEDVVLICPKDHSTRLRELVGEIRKRGLVDLTCRRVRATSAVDKAAAGLAETRFIPFAGSKTPKPWGSETLWARTDKFASKILFIRAGESLSLQYHERKSEAIVCLSGYGFFTSSGVRRPFSPGDSETVPPGTVHTVEADTDLILVEVSTPELDDVVRLQDRYGRA